MNLQLRRKRVSRSAGGDAAIFVFLALGAAFMALPMVFAISQAFKPLNELFLFPPQFFVRNPTLDNFADLLVLMSKSWVPMSRYFFNSVFIVTVGMAGQLVFASLAAYALAKHVFPGSRTIFALIILSLMFVPQVTAIPNYMTLAYLGWINTYLGVIIPAWGTTIGLYLMRQFLVKVHDSLLESARLDGASEIRVFWHIAMPICKPAWLTMIILVFQQLWGITGANMLYAEQLKTLPYALQQIIQGGVARAGVGAAVTLVMMAGPIIVFIFNQSKIVQTMGTSGLTE